MLDFTDGGSDPCPLHPDAAPSLRDRALRLVARDGRGSRDDAATVAQNLIVLLDWIERRGWK